MTSPAKTTSVDTVRADLKPLTVMILTGGSGRTAEQVVAAALAQFETTEIRILKKTGIRTVRAATTAVRQAAQAGAILCHTLVSPKVRSVVAAQTQRLNVPTVDVLGPLLTALKDQIGLPPRGRPGLYYELGKEQFDRIDAVNFTLAHDDGQRTDELRLADVVLVGVSRVSKSLTCFCLAARGIRAANVPLLPNRDPPRQLLQLESRRVVGLTMNADRLHGIRAARRRRMSRDSLRDYVDMHAIQHELRCARSLMSRHQWRCIDVSYMATEEVAHEVLSLIDT